MGKTQASHKLWYGEYSVQLYKRYCKSAIIYKNDFYICGTFKYYFIIHNFLLLLEFLKEHIL